jgi:hypothetical protein
MASPTSHLVKESKEHSGAAASNGMAKGNARPIHIHFPIVLSASLNIFRSAKTWAAKAS